MQVKKYFISAFLLLLSVFFMFFMHGYTFLALLLGFSGIVIFALQILSINENKIKRIIKRVIYSIVALGIICFIIPTVPMIKYSKSNKISADYCLILGCAVYGNYPSRVLNERINAAFEYLESTPECKAVLCGGKGTGENISEAECMFNVLVGKGINADRLILEDKSTNTVENIKNAKELLSKNNSIVIITSETHSYRSCFLAKRNGMNVVGTYSSKTHFPIIISNYIRECIAIWKDWIIK